MPANKTVCLGEEISILQLYFWANFIFSHPFGLNVKILEVINNTFDESVIGKWKESWGKLESYSSPPHHSHTVTSPAADLNFYLFCTIRSIVTMFSRLSWPRDKYISMRPANSIPLYYWVFFNFLPEKGTMLYNVCLIGHYPACLALSELFFNIRWVAVAKIRGLSNILFAEQLFF